MSATDRVYRERLITSLADIEPNEGRIYFNELNEHGAGESLPIVDNDYWRW